MRPLLKETLLRHDSDSWSIQENAGHFLTLETLWHGRLDDFLNNEKILRPAKFEDNQTDKANYDSLGDGYDPAGIFERKGRPSSGGWRS